ncbi:hypothetical protein F1188_15910, partial [Roseospira marina]
TDTGGDADEGADETDTGGDADEGADDGRKGKTPTTWADDLDAESLKGMDFDEGASKIIGDAAADAAAAAEYLIYTRDWDRTETFSFSEHAFKDVWMTRLDDETRSMVGVMQKDIERLMAARSQITHVPGYRSGRLHSASLHRLATRDTRVFRRRQENRSMDTAVSLLVDCSGSMRGPKMKMAMDAAYALSQTLERVNVRHECLGFTTDGFGIARHRGLSGTLLEAEEKKAGRHFSRIEPLYMPIFKGFEDRLTAEVRRRFAAAPHVCGLANNVDGECVEIAGQRLLKQRASRRVLIVLSDGAPCAQGSSSDQIRHLRNTIKNLSVAGVETVGIGIMSDAVEHFYPKRVVLDTLSALPSQVMKELRAILLQG